MKTINEYLNGNTYPGRGVLIGKSADNAHYVAAYFIMGRSENSRNRIFEPTEDGIRTRAFDEKKLTDPSLIIYSPVRKVNGCTVVTNGDQTDTVACEIAAGALNPHCAKGALNLMLRILPRASAAFFTPKQANTPSAY